MYRTRMQVVALFTIGAIIRVRMTIAIMWPFQKEALKVTCQSSTRHIKRTMAITIHAKCPTVERRSGATMSLYATNVSITTTSAAAFSVPTSVRNTYPSPGISAFTSTRANLSAMCVKKPSRRGAC